MKKLDLFNVAFEVTRRCNIRCEGYCMRGEAQNINMSKKTIEDFFNTQSRGYKLRHINNICFSGGSQL